MLDKLHLYLNSPKKIEKPNKRLVEINIEE